jgi:hypothetical protein
VEVGEVTMTGTIELHILRRSGGVRKEVLWCEEGAMVRGRCNEQGTCKYRGKLRMSCVALAGWEFDWGAAAPSDGPYKAEGLV